jgi:serine acetyltransferase
MIAAGSLVTKNVPARALVMGSPAKVVAWLNDDGSKMDFMDDLYLDNKGQEWKLLNNQLIKI